MKNLPFKAVAVDMDGTFMNSKNEYDHSKFADILKRLRKHGVHFIIASGRPISRLRIDFSEFLNQIDLISDNGGVLVKDNEVIRTTTFNHETTLKITDFVKQNYPDASIIVCGLKKSYILKGASAEFRKFMDYYYPNYIIIDDISQLPDNDPVDKFTVWSEAKPEEVEAQFNKLSKEKIHATDSGFNCMDIIPEGINKANGLKHFLDYFNISPDETIAFGDGMNDSEMLELVGLSYAMENADPEVKKIAKFEAPSNDDNGVFKVLEDYLEK